MSFSLSNSVQPHFLHFVPAGRISAAVWLYQALEPSFSNRSATAYIASLSIWASPHSLQKKIGIGTPHFLWREIHQSFLSLTIFVILSRPHEGIHLTLLIASTASSLKSSTEQNHWSVALNRIGVLHLQQWGYWWIIFFSANREPCSSRNIAIFLLASSVVKPANWPASSVRTPLESTGQIVGISG